ncbi:MAG: hypothetical protein JOY69_02730 [Candidatus Eremiobacteraeota bacterium]|nr:hypothetical protein [Candidatus Eremiobacteraeota bacterium]
MSVAAGLFLAAFGALGAWFLSKRFPAARFLRIGYILMSAGGVLFVTWALSKILSIGISAAGVMALGAVIGMVGALRKELRSTL